MKEICIADYVDHINGRTQVQDKIDEIMDNFDFEKVHKTMDVLEWTWAGEGVPEVPSLRARARQLLKEACFIENKSNYSMCSTGGFEAICKVLDYDIENAIEDWVNDAEHQIQVELRFVVESWGDI